jgi:hypothetical protein
MLATNRLIHVACAYCYLALLRDETLGICGWCSIATDGTEGCETFDLLCVRNEAENITKGLSLRVAVEAGDDNVNIELVCPRSHVGEEIGEELALVQTDDLIGALADFCVNLSQGLNTDCVMCVNVVGCDLI